MVRDGHRRRQRRDSGKQHSLYSQVVETGGTAGHGVQSHREAHQVAKRQKTGMRAELGPQNLLGFLQKKQARADKRFGIGLFE